MSQNEKLKLYGFNNLTKNLSFSFYKLHYLTEPSQSLTYNQYINKRYSAEKLTLLLSDVCHAIGGNILNIAKQNYEPQGASVTLMISEEAVPESLVAHLDKSHICIHTYPDDNIVNNLAIFRADLELSTCGVISPLKVINYLLEAFNADVVDIDYRVRGMTRNSTGKKLFIDEKLVAISNFLDEHNNHKYHQEDSNLATSNLFHTRLKCKNTRVEDSLFETDIDQVKNEQLVCIKKHIEFEVEQLFVKN